MALVAFACLPALAQAEDCTDSSCKQYEVEIPTAGGKEKKSKPQNEASKEAPAEASKAPEGKSENSPPSEGSSEEPEESKGTAPGNGGGGNNGPTDKGNSPGGNGSNQTSTGVGDEQSLGNPGGTSQGQNVSHSSGGSSPLVPILIAIAVLAAISIGAVIYRQRRQGSGGSGSPVSPNA